MISYNNIELNIFKKLRDKTLYGKLYGKLKAEFNFSEDKF